MAQRKRSQVLKKMDGGVKGSSSWCTGCLQQVLLFLSVAAEAAAGATEAAAAAVAITTLSQSIGSASQGGGGSRRWGGEGGLQANCEFLYYINFIVNFTVD